MHNLKDTLPPISRQITCPKALGYLALDGGDFPEATWRYEGSLAINRALGNRQGIADSLSHLGLIAIFEDDLPRARRLHAESLALWQDLGDQDGIAWALRHLGFVAACAGEHAAAASTLRQSLDGFEGLRHSWGIAWTLEAIAVLAARVDSPDHARFFAEAAAALRSTIGSPAPRASAADLERRIGVARQPGAAPGYFGDPGQSVDAAIADAREFLASLEAQDSASDSEGIASPQSPAEPALSKREGEVAALIARGLSNREIATHLVISQRTADRHVENILQRLGLHSRIQIALWVAERQRLLNS